MTLLNTLFPVSLNVKPKNVVLLGESGVGKSSVINLMAHCHVAETSSGIKACTQKAQPYFFTLSSQIPLCIIDTPGIDATDNVIDVIKSLPNTQDIDLLLFCVKGGRFTDSTERAHYLISELLRRHRVPLALVVTHLEEEDIMEDWWRCNEQTIKTFGICPVGHACVTARPADEMYAAQRVQSRRALARLLHGVFCTPNPSYMQAIQNRLAELIEKSISLLPRRKRTERLRRKLEEEYAFPRDEAQMLAEVIVVKSDTQ